MKRRTVLAGFYSQMTGPCRRCRGADFLAKVRDCRLWRGPIAGGPNGQDLLKLDCEMRRQLGLRSPGGYVLNRRLEIPPVPQKRDHRIIRSRHFHKMQRRHFIIFDMLPFWARWLRWGCCSSVRSG